MAKIKIKDLTNDEKVSKEELKKIFGGGISPSPFRPVLKLGPGSARSYIYWGAKDWDIIKY